MLKTKFREISLMLLLLVLIIAHYSYYDAVLMQNVTIKQDYMFVLNFPICMSPSSLNITDSVYWCAALGKGAESRQLYPVVAETIICFPLHDKREYLFTKSIVITEWAMLTHILNTSTPMHKMADLTLIRTKINQPKTPKLKLHQ